MYYFNKSELSCCNTNNNIEVHTKKWNNCLTSLKRDYIIHFNVNLVTWSYTNQGLVVVDHLDQILLRCFPPKVMVEISWGHNCVSSLKGFLWFFWTGLGRELQKLQWFNFQVLIKKCSREEHREMENIT